MVFANSKRMIAVLLHIQTVVFNKCKQVKQKKRKVKKIQIYKEKEVITLIVFNVEQMMKENIIYFHLAGTVWPLISVTGTQCIGISGENKSLYLR